MTIKNYGKVYQLSRDYVAIEYTLLKLTKFGFEESGKGLEYCSIELLKAFNAKMPEHRKINLDKIYVKDKYNNSKLWIIERSKCRHYYLSEYVGEYKQGKKTRLGKKYIYNMLFN